MSVRFALVATLLVCFAGCSKKDPAKANEAEAQKKDEAEKKDHPEAKTTPVPPGKVIACTDWVDGAKFGAALKEAGIGEEDEITPVDTRKKHKKSGLTSACDIVRMGEPPSIAKQKEMSKKTGRLGTLPGDPWCNLRAFCSIAEQTDYEKVCSGKGDRVNKELGVTACVRTSIMGKYDAFSYRLIDKDTKCLLEIRGGPSVSEEATVRTCAKIAMEMFTKATLKKAK